MCVFELLLLYTLLATQNGWLWLHLHSAMPYRRNSTEANDLNQSELLYFTSVLLSDSDFCSVLTNTYITFHHFRVRYIVIYYVNLYVSKKPKQLRKQCFVSSSYICNIWTREICLICMYETERAYSTWQKVQTYLANADHTNYIFCTI